MAIFPKIQSPCPYRGDLSAIMDGDMCRMCKRQVFDISALSDAERVAFISGCAEEVCVSYRFPMRAAAAAIALATLGAPIAAAQDFDETDMIVVGGINDPANVDYIVDSDESTGPELPIVYDEHKPRTEPDAPANVGAGNAEDQSAVRARPDLGHGVETD